MIHLLYLVFVWNNSSSSGGGVVGGGGGGGGEGWLVFPDLWSGHKTLIELIFNLCGEFRRSPEGPVGQIHFPHLIGAPGIFQIV